MTNDELTAIERTLDSTDKLIAEELRSARKWPCLKCGKLRTAEEGGRLFTVCDECWDASTAKWEGR